MDRWNCPGKITQNMGLRAYGWCESEKAITLKLLTSADLPYHLARIDKFEGSKYVRILVPIARESETLSLKHICRSMTHVERTLVSNSASPIAYGDYADTEAIRAALTQHRLAGE